jgi:RimJ/RimL family protein N-acetyltransferase
MLSLKLVQPADAEAYAAVVSSIHPDEIPDPEVLRSRWRDESRRPRDQARHLIVDGDRVCGLAFWSRPESWESGQPRLAYVNVRMTSSNQSEEDFGWILSRMEQEALGAGANLARAVTREDEPFHRRMLERHGYLVDRLSRSWCLDLVKHRESLINARSLSRKLMLELEIRTTTLASSVKDDVWRKLFELTVETIPDIPSSVREPIPTFETWLLGMRGPDMYAERIWTAWAEARLVGYSYLTYPQAGNVWTGYTATRKEDRQRGIARAVKLETIGQAVELGIESIQTNNDIENSAILHINQSLGYEPLPGFVTHMKPLA